ncbi:MAG: hypothetical protein ACR650_00070, partial [Methylocystis sp.]
MMADIDRAGLWPDAQMIWSQWEGYLKDPAGQKLETDLAPLIRDGAIFCVDAPFCWRGARGRSAFSPLEGLHFLERVGGIGEA